MRRIRIHLAYDGGPFHGWQVQPGLPTIQGLLEDVVTAIEGKPVHVAGSGRTDAGVHAVAQVAAFSIENPIPLPNLRRAVNRLLPPAIRVLSTQEVRSDFHPRFDAMSKTYEYRIFRDEVCSPFEWPYVYHHPYPLDEERMADFARVFEGEHDFSAFATTPNAVILSAAKNPRIQPEAPQLCADTSALASRYPEASASGLSPAAHEEGASAPGVSNFRTLPTLQAVAAPPDHLPMPTP